MSSSNVRVKVSLAAMCGFEGRGQDSAAMPPSFTQHFLLSIYYVPHTVLDTWDRSVNKADKYPALVKLIF